MQNTTKNLIENIANEIKNAHRILFITGAGISADSGLPTYRGIAGLYNNDKLTEENLRIEDCLSSQVFMRTPEITWKYLIQIADNCSKAKPNIAHKFIADLEKHYSKNNNENNHKEVFVLTQNIDNLHRLAGLDEDHLIEIHGNFQKLHCCNIRCNWEDDFDLYAYLEDFHNTKVLNLPKCPKCGGVAKVPVVLYGEMLPEKALNKFINELNFGFDLIIVIGTTCSFPYIYQPVAQAVRNNIPTIEVNPEKNTAISSIVKYHLQLGAADAFSEISEFFDFK